MGETRNKAESRSVEELSWPEYVDAIKKTGKGIVPVGAFEAHGHHGPLGFDSFISEAIAERLSEETGALLFPTIPYGCCTNGYDSSMWPGTISINPRVLTEFLSELGKELARQGIRTIVFVNCHIPNSAPLEISAFDIWKTTGAAVGVLEWWVAAQEEIRAIKGRTYGMHGDEIETSLVLASRRGNLVKLDRAVSNPDHPMVSLEEMNLYLSHAKFTRVMDERWVGTSANHGNPKLAKAEHGQKIISRCAQVGKDMFAALEKYVNAERLMLWKEKGSKNPSSLSTGS